jgi:outer membrane murein-binding lipoprotein Lpp
MLTGCVSQSEVNQAEINTQKAEINQLEGKINELKTQENQLQNSVISKKENNGTAKYIVTLNIRQSHFTLDITKHIKDAMNDIDIQIPVDKEFYDKVKVGDVIDDNFRMGSFVMEGSIGSWNITVKDKEVK